jgi:hypothetical protein
LRVAWNTGSPQAAEKYQESVVLTTNDPDQKAICFVITGYVQQLFACDPPEVVFDNLNPGEQRSMIVNITSIRNVPFQLVSFYWAVPVPGLRVEPVANENPEHATKQFKLTASAELPAGRFSTVLWLEAESVDGSRFRWELPVSGQRHARLSLVGAALDETGTCSLGVVRQGETQSCVLTLRVRDERLAPAGVLVAEVDSKVLRVSLDPVPTSPPGFYRLSITIPSDAPVCSHLGINAETITIHPAGATDPVLRLPVSYAVVPAGLR